MPTMNDVPVVRETRRGCGFRRGGGLYLRADGAGRDCGRLPLKLTCCPTCGEGIRQLRSWRWVDAAKLFANQPCRLRENAPAGSFLVTGGPCGSCPGAHPESLGRIGLLWIGKAFYRDVNTYNAESLAMGISRRISAVPVGFTLGETWVALAHPEAITETCANPGCCGNGFLSDGRGDRVPCESCRGTGHVKVPGIFRIFKPEAVEYVCRGDETDEELERLERRGLRLVRVEAVGEQATLPVAP